MSKNPWPYGQATREHIRSNLAAYSRRAVAAEGLRPAAVSVVLAPSVLESGADGATACLLTLRAPPLSLCSGDPALRAYLRANGGSPKRTTGVGRPSSATSRKCSMIAAVGANRSWPSAGR